MQAEPGSYRIHRAECTDGSGNYAILRSADFEMFKFDSAFRVHNARAAAPLPAKHASLPLGPAASVLEWRFLDFVYHTNCTVGDVTGDGVFR